MSTKDVGQPVKVAKQKEVVQSLADQRDQPAFISEGVRNDIEQYGETVDPTTGRTLTAADLK